MSKLTFVIPVAPYHSDIAQRAIESAMAQTVDCEIIVIHDTEGKGAGWARNQGLNDIEMTEYVCFLDADDTIDPTFADITLGILLQVSSTGRVDNRYVYTDWTENNTLFKAPDPCDAWMNGTYHLVTSVLPVDKVRLIGGFDEIMRGVEDADFYVRLRLAGMCGIHVNAPLVQYREGGQRSRAARASGDETAAKIYMTNRYGGLNFMGCCGDNTPHPLTPENEPLEGDVLAQAQWHGNTRQLGRATGRLYPRTSHPKLLYVAAEDVAAAPMHWKQVNSPVQATNGVILQPQYQAGSDWQNIADAIWGGGQAQVPSAPTEYKPHGKGRSKAAVVEKAQEWTRVEESLE